MTARQHHGTRFLATAFLAAGLICLVSPASAQAPAFHVHASPKLPVTSPPAPPSHVTGAAPASPSAHVLGVPIVPSAPVSPPYAGSAYKTIGGQAGTSADDLSEQNMPHR